jgi:hypothetical protein
MLILRLAGETTTPHRRVDDRFRDVLRPVFDARSEPVAVYACEPLAGNLYRMQFGILNFGIRH